MNGYKSLKIVDKKEWGNKYFSLFLKDKKISEIVFPGNFFMVKIPYFERGAILPRPFSIARVFKEKGMFELFFQVVGKGTEAFSNLNKGYSIEILGPLGNKFPSKTEKKTIMVAGGRGISPFLYLSEILKREKKDFILIYGGKSSKDIKFKHYLSSYNTLFVTEDGSYGKKGLVTDFLPKGNFTVFSCGPEIMMKKVYEFYKSTNSEVFVSLEERMACGTGVCYGCAKKIKIGDKIEMVRICQKGPVFNANEVVWDE